MSDVIPEYHTSYRSVSAGTFNVIEDYQGTAQLSDYQDCLDLTVVLVKHLYDWDYFEGTESILEYLRGELNNVS